MEVTKDRFLVGLNTELDGIQPLLVKKLWKEFRSSIVQFKFRLDHNYYSVNVYDRTFDPSIFSNKEVYSKWAAVLVKSPMDCPDSFSSLIIPAGTYAVFEHRGPASAFRSSAIFIYGDWLPASGFQLDHRPHFEILGPSYQPDDPGASEEVWIPVRK